MGKKIKKGISKAISKPAKTLGRVSTGVITGGLSEVARAAGAGNLMNKVDTGVLAAGGLLGGAALAGAAIPSLGGAMGMAGGAGAAGGAAAGGAGAAGSAGLGLLGKVVLGTSVASAIGQMFNKPPTMDFSEWKSQFTAEDQAYIDNLEKELTAIQQNYEMRTQAVDKLINDYPNVMAQSINTERQAIGKAYDETSKLVMDRAAQQLSAKFAATGGFNSGAFNQALGQEAIGLAQDRAQAELALGQREAAIPVQQYQMRLAETEALRDFQRTMLEGRTGERASAFQAMQNRNAGMASTEMQIRSQENQMRNQNRQALFGSLGSLAGNYMMARTMTGQPLFGGGRPANGSMISDPNAGFAELRTRGMASRAPEGVNWGRPITMGGY